MSPAVDRRHFLSTCAAGAAAAAAAPRTALAAKPLTDNPVCVFTKPFQSMSYDELADKIAELGFDGIEAPVRDGGHIEPQQVEEELPKWVEALRERGLKITVMASSVNDPDDPLNERVLRTAARLGIRRYRMKYLRYDEKQPIFDQLDQWRGRFRDLAAMNREIGIGAVYQNHASRNMLGAAIWDLRHVLEGIPADQIGVAYDIRHATVEGGKSWPVTFRMIRPHIDTVYIKDFHWTDGDVENVPLGQGQISRQFVTMLAESGFQGPISLHEEYLDHRKPELIPQHLAAIERDFATLRRWLGR